MPLAPLSALLVGTLFGTGRVRGLDRRLLGRVSSNTAYHGTKEALMNSHLIFIGLILIGFGFGVLSGWAALLTKPQTTGTWAVTVYFAGNPFDLVEYRDA